MRFWGLEYWQQWLRVAKSSGNSATLNPRQIYILPTVWGVLYAVMLVLLLVGAINYSLSLGYFVTFFLASLGHTAMLHTWRNLVHLKISVLHVKPVFAGETAIVAININDTKNRARYAIAAKIERNIAVIESIAANQSPVLSLQSRCRCCGSDASRDAAVVGATQVAMLAADQYRRCCQSGQ